MGAFKQKTRLEKSTNSNHATNDARCICTAGKPANHCVQPPRRQIIVCCRHAAKSLCATGTPPNHCVPPARRKIIVCNHRAAKSLCATGTPPNHSVQLHLEVCATNGNSNRATNDARCICTAGKPANHCVQPPHRRITVCYRHAAKSFRATGTPANHSVQLHLKVCTTNGNSNRATNGAQCIRATGTPPNHCVSPVSR